MKKYLIYCLLAAVVMPVYVARATEEVDKDKIPPERLAADYKQLPWGVAVWDNAEAIPLLREKSEDVLWVDTRPSSFYKQGTVRGAVELVYDKADSVIPDSEPALTKESLAAALEAAGNPQTIAFFCQGPHCHRSYNASWRAVAEWGYPVERVVWYRDGYPELYKAVTEDTALRRRAGRYLSDEGEAALP
ncbi:MAG: rhodanese-like domain-containing protein [Kiritimatiellae bacterium]|nr:rhodanese-like domain-containing protein [Kiritimatiellia bacterium]